MNKQLVVLAVAGALAPALSVADDSTVTLYGKINVGIEYVKATGATPSAGNAADVSGRTRVTDSFSSQLQDLQLRSATSV